jgi:hypothetical protein
MKPAIQEGEPAWMVAARADIEEKLGEPEPQRAFQIPEIRYAAFGLQMPAVRDASEKLIDWLRVPFVSGKGGFPKDHDEWSAWRNEFKQKYGPEGYEFLQPWLENKYRVNVQSRPGIFIENLIVALEGTSDENQELAERLEELYPITQIIEEINAHRDAPLGERKRFVVELEDRVVAVLDAVADASNKRAAPPAEEKRAIA